MQPSIVVLGSINMDLVVQAGRFPKPGETIMGSSLTTHPGGKGANQAIAAARLGADVKMVGCVGDDSYGHMLLEILQREGVDTTSIRTVSDCSTGIAAITVNQNGENTIIVVPGANSCLNSSDIRIAQQLIEQADVLLMQLEVPMDVVEEAAAKTKPLMVKTILNAAPAMELSASLLQHIDMLIVNETEAAIVVNNSELISSRELIETIPVRDDAYAVLTLGAAGCITHNSVEGTLEHGAFKVNAVDTTAAGDAFCGALAVSFGKKMWSVDKASAIRFAAAAGAIAATRNGAQPSLPTLLEVETLLNTRS